MSFTDILADARRVVRSTFGEEAEYTHSSVIGSVTLSVTLHNRIQVRGNIGDDGYSDVIEGVNRVFFNKEELAEKNVVLYRGGRLTFTDPRNDGLVLVLDSQEKDIGPINQIWNVGIP